MFLLGVSTRQAGRALATLVEDAVSAATVSAVAKALDMYKLDNHKYPTTDEGLNALVQKPASAKTWPDGGYLSRMPEDPWGHPFQYVYPGSNGRRYDLYSLGADGAEGGTGYDADIYYQ